MKWEGNWKRKHQMALHGEGRGFGLVVRVYFLCWRWLRTPKYIHTISLCLSTYIVVRTVHIYIYSWSYVYSVATYARFDMHRTQLQPNKSVPATALRPRKSVLQTTHAWRRSRCPLPANCCVNYQVLFSLYQPAQCACRLERLSPQTSA
jgi:hypothetical protein